MDDEIETESVATQTEATVLEPAEPGTCSMHVRRNVGVRVTCTVMVTLSYRVQQC